MRTCKMQLSRMQRSRAAGAHQSQKPCLQRQIARSGSHLHLSGGIGVQQQADWVHLLQCLSTWCRGESAGSW